MCADVQFKTNSRPNISKHTKYKMCVFLPQNNLQSTLVRNMVDKDGRSCWYTMLY